MSATAPHARKQFELATLVGDVVDELSQTVSDLELAPPAPQRAPGRPPEPPPAHAPPPAPTPAPDPAPPPPAPDPPPQKDPDAARFLLAPAGALYVSGWPDRWARNAAPKTANRHRRRARRALRRITKLGVATVLILAVTAAGLVGAALVTGHGLETVVTGSMQPQIPVGSLVVTDHISAAALAAGDVIAFPQPCSNARIIVVHRVVDDSIDSTGNVAVRTKGDANPGEDRWPGSCSTLDSNGALVTPPDARVDRVVYVVPAAGTVFDAARRYALIALVGLGILLIAWRAFREVRHSRTASTPA